MLKLTIALIITVALMIVAISKWKVHPFIAIITLSILLAIAVGIPLDSIPSTVGKGFSAVFAGVGLVIIFGMLIGLVLEKSGAAVKLAEFVLKAIGPKHPALAMMLVGWIVSIPVFCDSGFVIINPIRKNLAARTGVSPVSLAIALSAGLYASHVFIPPTPGPVAAAGMMGLENNLVLVLGIGALVSVFALVPAYFFCRHLGKTVVSEEKLPEVPEDEDGGAKPSTLTSALPILVPVILMALGSFGVVTFLGKPVIALMVGFFFSLIPLWQAGGLGTLYDICQEALKQAGPIIFITAAGGVLGQVITDANFVQYVQESVGTVSHFGIFLPFIIAAVIKSSVGSSTVAITTTAGIMGMFSSSDSLLHILGMTSPLAASLAVMAIGAGAMVVSHANDSYFWVVTGFSGISPAKGYRTQTLMTLVAGLGAMAGIFVLSLFMI